MYVFMKNTQYFSMMLKFKYKYIDRYEEKEGVGEKKMWYIPNHSVYQCLKRKTSDWCLSIVGCIKASLNPELLYSPNLTN